MPIIFNEKGLPLCCGEALPPRWPVSYCLHCGVGYEARKISEEVAKRVTPAATNSTVGEAE